MTSTHIPRVSVCVPSYNHSRFLPRALDSILAQTFQDIEIIIVDDGSTDDSFEIAQRYAADHPAKIRIYYHAGHQNRGPSATVNLAFEHTRGEYWMGLPSDDLLYPEKLTRQVKFLDNNPEFGWVYCYADFVDEEDQVLKQHGLFGVDITKTADPVDELIRGNKVPGMTALMRRDVSERIGLHEESLLYSDWHYWVRMTAGSKVGFIDEPLVHYRMHGTNTSIRVESEINVQRCIDATLAIRRDIDEGAIAIASQRSRALIELQLGCFAFCLNRTDEAKNHLERALQIDSSLLTDASYLPEWLNGWYSYSCVLLTPPTKPSELVGWFIDNLPAGLLPLLQKRLEAEQLAQLALENFEIDPQKTRQFALQSILKDRRQLSNKALRRAGSKAFAGEGVINLWRRIKRNGN